MNVRFTAWFSPDEYRAIKRIAQENRTSMNVVVRSAVCQLLDRPFPLLHVTTATQPEREAGHAT